MRRIQPGDVVAIAVEGVRCAPVGIARDVDDDAVILNLFSWISGRFAGPDMLIRRRDIRATMWASKMTDAEIIDRGYVLEEGEVMWNVDPLGEFQARWQAA